MDTFKRLESEVRGYCRSFPTVFKTAYEATLVNEEGQKYTDFFGGAGALNYGHNHPCIREKLVDYIMSGGVTHSLDMMTSAKQTFLERFDDVILKPRDMHYKFQFPGPTGTNAVESALKLARKYTGRREVIFFTNGFHGMTLGSLAVTGNAFKRHGAGVTLNDTTSMPFDGYMGDEVDTIALLEAYLENKSSGVEMPAAFILETVQAEGGVYPCSKEWIQRLQALAKKYGIVFIADDIQAGCGRTGKFFSFEEFDIEPDIICLSKSLSGYGVPFALVLMRPELDVWAPGEHNGTFRGHNLAFVTAEAALSFWEDDTFEKATIHKGELARKRFEEIAASRKDLICDVRGRGMMQGLEFTDPDMAGMVSKECFEHNLIIETAGSQDEVLKLLSPLVIPEEQLLDGINIIEKAIDIVAERHASKGHLNGKMAVSAN